jgi:4-diphosphocytidyl-2-C-methyl-D-erythritol kinase
MARSYRSFAKINLHLQVEARRPDGYHELRTIFQTVSLHDLVTVEALDSPVVELSVPDGGAPEGDSNLAYRAARRLLDHTGSKRGVRIELRKRIPAGGGLGGGSSNAATVLVATCEALGLWVPPPELAAVAAELGADVPFFLVGGTALGLGRGDRIVPLPDLPEQELVLVDPGVSVSTAEVFRGLEVPRPRPLPRPLQEFLDSGSVSDLAGLGGFNDLEGAVLAGFPAVRSVYNALGRAGASLVRLSGSGATVFACFADPQLASGVGSYLPSDAKIYAARTLSRPGMSLACSVGVGEGGWL